MERILHTFFRNRAPLILGVLLVAAAGAALYYWRQYADIKQNPEKISQQEVMRLVSLIGRHLILPEGETPTIATVTDPDRLKGKPFFAHAKQGDKVLIYATAKKAILYDPAADRIVEVAPLTIGGQ